MYLCNRIIVYDISRMGVIVIFKEGDEKMAVEITEQEKKSSLYKYFERDIALPMEKLEEMVADCEINEKDVLLPDHMNDLFLEGNLPGEFGYCRLRDGGAAIANYKKMPDVTVEMFDWWFCWHVLDPMRYKIWDKNNHIYCLTKNPDKICDESIPLHARYWNTGCEIIETHIPGENPGHVVIPFRNPEDIGFDTEKLKQFKGTIVCSGDEKTPVTMVHFVRPCEDGGIELRSRFWFGFHVVNQKTEKMDLPQGVVFSEERLKHSLIHNINEFSNLEKILPELYREYGNKSLI